MKRNQDILKHASNHFWITVAIISLIYIFHVIDVTDADPSNDVAAGANAASNVRVKLGELEVDVGGNIGANMKGVADKVENVANKVIDKVFEFTNNVNNIVNKTMDKILE